MSGLALREVHCVPRRSISTALMWYHPVLEKSTLLSKWLESCSSCGVIPSPSAFMKMLLSHWDSCSHFCAVRAMDGFPCVSSALADCAVTQKRRAQAAPEEFGVECCCALPTSGLPPPDAAWPPDKEAHTNKLESHKNWPAAWRLCFLWDLQMLFDFLSVPLLLFRLVADSRSLYY